ncbi:ATP-binding protein [Malaciobacter molluscorum]|uniref:DUF2062 domain-containing protein n=1 Tax=Malaciobacter molluscorum TaxID=1032072 RepID=UPI00100A98FD|nr:DUF2062 domain-containing protein [Malaciobacter molluscorum]RXJ96163.1 ATP-binding protein [Malaciobacter molluscorum]
MLRKKLEKILPTHEKVQKQKFLKIFGKLLYKREIWSLSRRKVAWGVFIGIFVACIPMPLQMLLATFLAIIFNANFPISFALIFVSNPITMPPLFYFEYEIGNFIFQSKNPVIFSFKSMYDNLDQIALSLYTGAIILGVISAFICMYLTNFYWISNVRRTRIKRIKELNNETLL